MAAGRVVRALTVRATITRVLHVQTRWTQCHVMPTPRPQEHAVAPFFVFQVVCVLLWSLDDYWYYSLMTLALLVVFEATVCNQRQRSLELLRSMRRPAYPLYAYREGSWQLLSSEALVPGEDHVFWVGAWDSALSPRMRA